jgi:tetratricopeptide (TPR) repeat protein
MMATGMSRRPAILTAILVAALAPALAHGEPTSPAVEQRRQPPAAASAQSEYERGVRARIAKDWTTAVEAFLRAVTEDTAFPEAWNELGFALRNQGRYTESLAAYDEALRLRPEYPEALEYLGEAYVKLGRMDDARRVLDRLRVLDPPRADELAEEIAKGP